MHYTSLHINLAPIYFLTMQTEISIGAGSLCSGIDRAQF
jgi:hypothetical protein